MSYDNVYALQDYKNRVSKYKNKLNQLGGFKCKFKKNDLVVKKSTVDSSTPIFGIVQNVKYLPEGAYNLNPEVCYKVVVKLINNTIEEWYVDLIEIMNELFLPEFALDNILKNLNMTELIMLYNTGNIYARNRIAYIKWDFYNHPIPRYMTLRQFIEIFPNCKGINIEKRNDITDADFVYLRGIHFLNMNYCSQITIAGVIHLRGIHTLDIISCYDIRNGAFVHLRGIHTLDISRSNRVTDTAFVHLSGIHTLDISGCNRVTDTGFVHLSGIHTLNISRCTEITDAAFMHLRGIHTLIMEECMQITGEGFVHLKGIHTLNIQECNQITNVSFVHLRGIHSLYMRFCRQIGPTALVYLYGIDILYMYDCNQYSIKYARRIRLPVLG
jgi:hypothetical protein